MKIEYTSNGSLQEIEFDENNSKDIIEKTAPIRQLDIPEHIDPLPTSIKIPIL